MNTIVVIIRSITTTPIATSSASVDASDCHQHHQQHQLVEAASDLASDLASEDHAVLIYLN